MDGVLVLDKPKGLSSFDVVARLRRILRTSAIGHAGTLDPMATGVLVVCIGEATKLATHLTAHPKRYVAELTLGVATNTLDAEGSEVERLSVPTLDAPGALDAAIAFELARTLQIPPSFSAIHVDGERAYALARKGEAVILPARPVRVHELLAECIDTSHLQLRVFADKGYYVRSLGADFAKHLGTCGHLSALRRIASGPFLDSECGQLEQADLASRMLPMNTAAKRALPSAVLTPLGVILARVGKLVPHEEFTEFTPGPFERKAFAPSAALKPESISPGSHAGSSAEALPEPPFGPPEGWFDAAGVLVALGHRNALGGRVVRGFMDKPATSS